ncbi:hypothetical protein MCUN1_001848 [Malassezia cuniculi]|uniref:PWI domain-containing protein n=1 Tax=Malassezia cuniculi TaxID=948313 RepID=A0AAF0EYI0_9BASI|nr:hypothetical protein MCUN1_001848 [Malassezia cuniculi]
MDRGVSQEQDARFKDKEKTLLGSSRFPAMFDTKVDMQRVNMPVMRQWIVERVEELLGMEDEVLVEYVLSQLESERYPDPRKMQISLTGFLEKNARIFMAELWRLLLDAQDSVGGIPKLFVERKKREMAERRVEESEMMAQVQRRAPEEPRAAPVRGRRWDKGEPPITREFVDRHGNVTRHERDNGWVRRAGTTRYLSGAQQP